MIFEQFKGYTFSPQLSGNIPSEFFGRAITGTGSSFLAKMANAAEFYQPPNMHAGMAYCQLNDNSQAGETTDFNTWQSWLYSPVRHPSSQNVMMTEVTTSVKASYRSIVSHVTTYSAPVVCTRYSKTHSDFGVAYIFYLNVIRDKITILRSKRKSSNANALLYRQHKESCHPVLANGCYILSLKYYLVL